MASIRAKALLAADKRGWTRIEKELSYPRPSVFIRGQESACQAFRPAAFRGRRR
jgi:hypothetical protein